MCNHNVITHNVVFIFSYRTLNNFNKLSATIAICNKEIDKFTIQAILCQNVTMFLPKILPFFLQMLEKLKTQID